jgi:hypothetical protein
MRLLPDNGTVARPAAKCVTRPTQPATENHDTTGPIFALIQSAGLKPIGDKTATRSEENAPPHRSSKKRSDESRRGSPHDEPLLLYNAVRNYATRGLTSTRRFAVR